MFENLELRDVGDSRIHYGSAHPHNKKLVYYVCKDKPIYDVPTIKIRIKVVMQN